MGRDSVRRPTWIRCLTSFPNKTRRSWLSSSSGRRSSRIIGPPAEEDDKLYLLDGDGEGIGYDKSPWRGKQ